MSSSYSKGKRIALHIVQKGVLTPNEVKAVIDKIKSACGDDVLLSTHCVITDGEAWFSIENHDSFFKGVYHTDDVKEFIDLIKRDRSLSGMDVAQYILSKVKCTHLKLQKLVYLCYAEYLCNTKKRLFDDKIYAFQYGPVVDSVYKHFHGKYDVGSDCDTPDMKTEVKTLPAKSRILFAEFGIDKLVSIDRTIEKYGEYSAHDLVDITHSEKGPWKKVYIDGKRYIPISDDVILQYHQYEK